LPNDDEITVLNVQEQKEKDDHEEDNAVCQDTENKETQESINSEDKKDISEDKSEPTRSEIIEDLRKSYSHVDPRSHLASMRFTSNFDLLQPPIPLTMNPDAADQDASLLLTQNGHLLLSSFSWYAFPPNIFPGLRGTKILVYGNENTGMRYLLWGAFTRYSEDSGYSWSTHRYLPAIPNGKECVYNKRPCYGGALRGNAIQFDNRILLATYAQVPKLSETHSIHLYESLDNGKTFRYCAPIAWDENNEVSFYEPSLYRSPCGKIVALLRSDGLEGKLATVSSSDNGKSWTSWKEQPIVGHPYHAINVGENLALVVYGYREEPYGIRARLCTSSLEDLDSASEFIVREDGGGADIGYPWATYLGKDPKSGEECVCITYYFYTKDDEVRHIAASILSF